VSPWITGIYLTIIATGSGATFGGTGGPIPWLWIGRGITSSSHLRLPLRYYGVYHNMEADQDNSRYTINV
jgi:hypothetical protein